VGASLLFLLLSLFHLSCLSSWFNVLKTPPVDYFLCIGFFIYSNFLFPPFSVQISFSANPSYTL
jgi:hypothetical protein